MGHKIVVTSDNHINILFKTEKEVENIIDMQVKHIKEQGITHLIINGDISWNHEQVFSYLNHLEASLKDFCEVYYTIGNHDLSKNYNLKDYFDIKDNRYLPNNEIVLEKSKKVIIGNDGFFDYSFSNPFLNYNRLNELNDYTNKRYFKDEYFVNPSDVLSKLLKQAEKKLKWYNDNGYEIIYITHYIPKREFVLPNATDNLIFKNAFMGSTLIGKLLEKYNVTDCYFGHTHRRLGDVYLNGINYHCNPLGLPKNWLENGIEQSDFITEWKRTLTIIYDVSEDNV